MSVDTLRELPISWKRATIGELVIEKVPQSGPTLGDKFTYVDIGSIDNRKKSITDPKSLAQTEAPSRAKQVLETGDVLVSMTRPNLNAVALIPPNLDQAIGSTGFDVLRTQCVEPSWLFYTVQTNDFIQAMCQVVQGALYPAVRPNDIRSYSLALPPRAERCRIIAKIEQLFSDLDAGVAALKRAKANLKRYRAAILKAAVEGKLTEEWRTKHTDTEPASTLLARILTERRQKWEADQLLKFAANQKEPPKSWREKYVEPSPPETTDLPEPPTGWCWASLGQLLVESPQNGAYYPRKKYGSGYLIIRIDDYQQFWSRGVELLQRVDAPKHEQATYGLDENDILINRVNSLSHLGKVLLVEARHLPSIFESNMMKLRPCKQSVSVFLRDYLRSFNGTQRLIANAKWAVNQASINQQDVQATPVPLPSLEEQSVVAREVAEKLSLIEAAETAIGHGLLRAARLRQSILKHAFEGKLVPQDPTDEPASKLLERIHRQPDTIKQPSPGDSSPRRAGRPRKTRPALPLFAQDDGDDQGGDS